MTARDQFAAMTGEDILIEVAIESLRHSPVDTMPSQRGYEAHGWDWTYSEWRNCMASGLYWLQRKHGHHFKGVTP